MNSLLLFWRSTIGKKVVMAVTGLIGIGFVIGHMTGNLLSFQGAEAIDSYAIGLRELGHGAPLWIIRGVLVAAVILHVTAAFQLTRMKQVARPHGYEKMKPQVSTWGVRTMRFGGVLLLVWLVFHILHFTIGTVHPQFIHLRPFHNLTTAFTNPLIVGFYLVAMVFLGLHLYHGTWASLRTLGVNKASTHPLRRRIPTILAIVLVLGFASVPLAIFFGIIG